MLHAEVIALDIKIDIGEDELLLDQLPDHSTGREGGREGGGEGERKG